MDAVEREKYGQARKRVWEALQCLVDTKPIMKRIAAAGRPLFALHNRDGDLVEQLPPEARTKFDEVIQLLTKHPPAHKYDNEIDASVSRLSPRQMARITKNVLDIYVKISGGL
jgi:hypothetical protein